MGLQFDNITQNFMGYLNEKKSGLETAKIASKMLNSNTNVCLIHGCRGMAVAVISCSGHKLPKYVTEEIRKFTNKKLRGAEFLGEKTIVRVVYTDTGEKDYMDIDFVSINKAYAVRGTFPDFKVVAIASLDETINKVYKQILDRNFKQTAKCGV